MFSVIIPCFDAGKLLGKSLAGLVLACNQTKEKIEIILIDNNSLTNDTYNLYKKYFDKLSIQLLLQPRLTSTFSLSRARNQGIQLATYPWLALLDSDVIVNPHYFSKLCEYITDDSQLICGERVFISGKELKEEQIKTDTTLLRHCSPIKSHSNYGLLNDRRRPYFSDIEKHPHPWSIMHGGNLIFSKKQLLSNKPFDEAYDGHWGYEDTAFAHTMITNGANPSFCAGAFVYHQEPETSIPPIYDRYNKQGNPNWRRICNTIPGFAEYKKKEYSALTQNIVC